jgi:mono/diheme cytochrome c family protein
MTAIRKLLCVLPVAAAIGLAGPAAQGQMPSPATRGKEIAERVCSGCHAVDDRQGGTFQGTDVPSFKELANRPRRTPETLQSFIMTPRHPMPAIPLELKEIRDVVAYIESLK